MSNNKILLLHITFVSTNIRTSYVHEKNYEN